MYTHVHASTRLLQIITTDRMVVNADRMDAHNTSTYTRLRTRLHASYESRVGLEAR
jgi:hypothetical protein